MTKRKTPFFFTFKGLSNSPIFQYLKFSFHRHFKAAPKMVLTELLSIRTMERSLLTKLDGCQWKEQGKIPDTSRHWAGVMKRDKIRYF